MSSLDKERQISALYRKAQQEQPPEMLDARIRHHAHRAVKRRKHVWFNRSQLAVAATLVLGIGLAFRVFEVAPPQEMPMPAASHGLAVPQIREQIGEQAAAPSQVYKSLAPAPKTTRPDALASDRASVEAMCGSQAPADSTDRKTWEARIKQLNADNQHALARCLRLLYQQRSGQPLSDSTVSK